ncbi:MAG: GDSL-type esterase/lipase family protein, partial [Clostridium sp.]
LDKEIIPQENTRKKASIRTELSKHTFGKIYLMIGINELGRGTADTYIAQYRTVLQTLHELQPQALIIIESILHVSSKKDAEQTYINNAAIDERNLLLATLADNSTYFYLDENPVFDGSDNSLVSDYSYDGVHLKASYIKKLWKPFLLEHGLVEVG